MKKTEAAAIFLTAVFLSVSGCGTINDEAENKRLMLEQPNSSIDETSDICMETADSVTTKVTASTTKKDNIQTEKRIIEKAVKGNSTDTDEPDISCRTYLKETTDQAKITGIHDNNVPETFTISFRPDDLEFTLDARCIGLAQAEAYSPEEKEKLKSDLIKIQTDALEKYGYWRRSSIMEFQENYEYEPDSYVTADLDPGKLKNIWLVDVHNPDGALLYDADTLKIVTVSQLFGENWQNFTSKNDIKNLESFPVQCFITFDEWSFTAKINNGGDNVEFTALYKEINPKYADLS